MKATFRLIVALMLLIGWGLAASSLHVVRTGGAPVVIPKNRIGIADTYVDVRNWTIQDVANHPAVVKRLIATEKADVLTAAVGAKTHEELITQLTEAVA